MRVWLERAEDAGVDESEWRGRIRRVQDEAVVYFRHLHGIADAFMKFFEDAPDARADDEASRE